jgi:putative restriction endonuclease
MGTPPTPTRVPWSRDELLVAFRLYCRTPFGKLHRLNPDIIALSRALGRTPSAVGMKACNFASLDPVQRARNITALGNVGRADRELWDAFLANPEAIAAEAEAAYARLTGRDAPPLETELDLPEGPTETVRTIRARRVQSFFRAAVLASYEYRCALSDIALPHLLNASHIIPWKTDTARRADPRNGIALNALYDRAFDRGLITFDNSLRVVLSPRLRATDPPPLHRQALLEIEGRPLRLPHRFAPDPAALAYHRERVFA